MITTFWWVRHGPTHETAFTGWRDVPADLSDHARLQRLSTYLPQDAVVISSDLSRTIQTARAIAAGRAILPSLKGLREFNFGDWDGKTFDEVSAQNPQHARAFWETPGTLKAPNGESWHDLSARVEENVEQLLQTYMGQNIIAVAHIGVILTQVQKALGVSAYKAMSNPIDNLSVTTIEHSEDGWQAHRINHCP